MKAAPVIGAEVPSPPPPGAMTPPSAPRKQKHRSNLIEPNSPSLSIRASKVNRVSRFPRCFTTLVKSPATIPTRPKVPEEKSAGQVSVAQTDQGYESSGSVKTKSNIVKCDASAAETTFWTSAPLAWSCHDRKGHKKKNMSSAGGK